VGHVVRWDERRAARAHPVPVDNVDDPGDRPGGEMRLTGKFQDVVASGFGLSGVEWRCLRFSFGAAPSRPGPKNTTAVASSRPSRTPSSVLAGAPLRGAGKGSPRLLTKCIVSL
jgi:hypothetical protein